MSNLKQTLESIAEDFAKTVIEALRSASIDEITGLASVPVRAEQGRRNGDQIGQTLESVVSLLKKHPEGLRAEQIREALRVDAKELPRPIADGLKEGRLSKKGEKRATVYYAKRSKT